MLSYVYFIMKSNEEHRNCELGFGVLFCLLCFVTKLTRICLKP